MKKTVLILAAFSTLSIHSQTKTFSPQTGDVELDKTLTEINEKAKANKDAFVNDVSAKFNLGRDKVTEMTKVMEPADVYMAAQTAEVINKPVDDVVKTYEANKGKGWGETAKQLGIKPGSPEFHAMKDKIKAHGNKKNQSKKANNKKGKVKKDKDVKEKGSKEAEGKEKTTIEKDENSGGKGKSKK